MRSLLRRPWIQSTNLWHQIFSKVMAGSALSWTMKTWAKQFRDNADMLSGCYRCQGWVIWIRSSSTIFSMVTWTRCNKDFLFYCKGFREGKHDEWMLRSLFPHSMLFDDVVPCPMHPPTQPVQEQTSAWQDFQTNILTSVSWFGISWSKQLRHDCLMISSIFWCKKCRFMKVLGRCSSPKT